MTIQWYPGHMHKAQKEIKQALHKVDLIIEVVDARIPFSSSNPVIAQLSDFKGLNRPVIKLINKTDLADPNVTELWCDYFEQQQGVKALPVSALQPADLKKLSSLARKLVPGKAAREEAISAMIMGIPNVGKSTIINVLSGRKIAKVGNEPAVTQRQQRIDLLDGLVLFDTPGILWPKIENRNSSYRLAISGAIKDTVLDYDDIAFYLIDFLVAHYSQLLNSQYQLEQLPEETIEIVEAIGKKRGCLKAGGRVDLDKVSKIIINEYRAATLGRVSLETPTMLETESAEVEARVQTKLVEKRARKQKFKKKR